MNPIHRIQAGKPTCLAPQIRGFPKHDLLACFGHALAPKAIGAVEYFRRTLLFNVYLENI